MANGRNPQPNQLRVTVTLNGDDARNFLNLKAKEFLDKDSELGAKLIREGIARRQGKIARTG